MSALPDAAFYAAAGGFLIAAAGWLDSRRQVNLAKREVIATREAAEEVRTQVRPANGHTFSEETRHSLDTIQQTLSMLTAEYGSLARRGDETARIVEHTRSMMERHLEAHTSGEIVLRRDRPDGH